MAVIFILIGFLRLLIAVVTFCLLKIQLFNYLCSLIAVLLVIILHTAVFSCSDLHVILSCANLVVF